MPGKNEEAAVEETENRIEQLEFKVAFQEQAIQQLSDEVYRQQQEMERMEARYLLLSERFMELHDSFSQPRDEKPPHY